MGAMDLGRWHRGTVADGRYADYRSHRMADGCCADGTAQTMGLRRCEPLGAHLRNDQCLADCSTTFGTRWGGRGSLAGCRAWQGGAAAAPPGWRTRGVLCAGCGPPAYLRTPVGCQLQLQRQRQRRQAGAPEEPRAPGARHPSPGACPWDASLTAVAAAAPPSWLRPTSAVARPSRSRALTCPGERRPCAQPFCSVGSVSRAFTHWTHPHSIP